MQPDATFNSIADAYDSSFTTSTIGTMQRGRVWRYLEKFTAKPMDILEINCGTGEDARWLASRGHHVTATDAAEKMIEVARRKHGSKVTNKIAFSVCAFDQLKHTFGNRQFDLIFSDFAGLNCIREQELVTLDRDFAALLKPGGRLIVVLLGKKSWMEWVFFRCKGDRKNAIRRRSPAMAKLDEHTSQPTYCYSVKEVQTLFSSFKVLEYKPVGLFIPPSYLEPLVNRNRFLRPLIQLAETLVGGISWFSNYADHTWMVLQKR